LRGFKCLTAKNGRDAIRIAENERPSLIILDLIMPEMDGIETHKILKSSKKTKNIPIIAYSAQDPEVILKKGDEAFDVVDFILKPFSVEKLIALVEKSLKKYN